MTEHDAEIAAYNAGITEGRAAERARILKPAGYNDRQPGGSIGPGAVPDGLSQDPAYWYRRWLFALNQLDEEAGERLAAYANFNEKLADVVRLAEREACAQLAEDNNVIYFHNQPELSCVAGRWVPFADLIRARTTP